MCLSSQSVTRTLQLLLLATLWAWPVRSFATETIRINGSGTGLEMMKPLIQAYLKTTPDVLFVMKPPLGSSGAHKALAAGALDIAVSSKPLTQQETEQGLRLTPFGRTPLAIVAGLNVPLSGLTTTEIEAIYTGRTRKWSNNAIIRLILRPMEDIDTKILRRLSPGMDEAIDQAHNRRGILTAVTDPESNEAVSKIPGSLGTAGLAGLLVEKPSLKILSLNGVMPTVAALEQGRYPLAKPIHFVTREPLSESAQRFLLFVYSDAGRDIVARVGVQVVPDGM